VLGWSWWKRKSWGRHVLLGLGFFLLNLAPVLGFVKMSYLYISGVADHFVYVPLLGLIGLAVAGAGALIGRLDGPRRASVYSLAAAICALLALQSHRYAGVFRDEETLWTYTVRHNPGSWVAHHNLAGILVDTGRVPEGLARHSRPRPLGEQRNESGVGTHKFRHHRLHAAPPRRRFARRRRRDPHAGPAGETAGRRSRDRGPIRVRRASARAAVR
jgi:hypothetical protein